MELSPWQWVTDLWQRHHGPGPVNIRVVAEGAGVSKQTLYRWSRGGAADDEALGKVAGYFGVPPLRRGLVEGVAGEAAEETALDLLRGARRALERAEALLLTERRAALQRADRRAPEPPGGQGREVPGKARQSRGAR